MSKKSLLFLNHSLAMGGIETMILDFSRYLIQKGFTPYAAVFESGGSLEAELESAGSYTIDLGKKSGIDLLLPFKIKKVLNQYSINIIHSHNYSAWFYAILTKIIKLGNLRVIHTEHSTVDSLKRRYYLERVLSYFTDKIVAVSDKVRYDLIEKVGVNPKRIITIANGVDTEKFKNQPKSRQQLRDLYHIDDATIVIGIIARLEPVKNHLLLINSFIEVLKECKHIKLFIVGNGSLYQELFDFVKDAGIDDFVVFTGEKRNIPEYLNLFDIFTLTSIDEGMNLTLLESQSVGLPAVVTDVGGNREIISHEKNGLLAKSDDKEDFVKNLKKLVLNDELRQIYGECARSNIEAKFSLNNTIDKYINYYI